jgi:hypothetical protein
VSGEEGLSLAVQRGRGQLIRSRRGSSVPWRHEPQRFASARVQRRQIALWPKKQGWRAQLAEAPQQKRASAALQLLLSAACSEVQRAVLSQKTAHDAW